MCLDSDIFDLWRSCGDCNITRTEPECQLSCEYCLAGEGIDTADHPAPRADQVLAIPAQGCSVDRRDFELECRAQSQGTCGETWLRPMLCSTLTHPLLQQLLARCVITFHLPSPFLQHCLAWSCHSLHVCWPIPQLSATDHSLLTPVNDTSRVSERHTVTVKSLGSSLWCMTQMTNSCTYAK